MSENTDTTTSNNLLKPKSLILLLRILLFGILLLGILLLGFGFWMDYQWFTEKQLNILLLLNLTPGIGLLAVWYRALRNVNQRWRIIRQGVIITLAVNLCIVCLNIQGFPIEGITKGVDDSSRYSEIKKEIGDSILIRHFPAQIPGEAINVKFAYFGEIFRGGGFIQLRLQLPHDEISKLLNDYRLKAKYTFVGGNKYDHTDEKNGVPTTSFHTSGTDDETFPNTYEILVLDAQNLEDDPEFTWNHGYSYGVAISDINSEIVYWAEDW